ncbi:MAG: hypothetical protein RL596_1496 [Bacteroidota bacterium]
MKYLVGKQPFYLLQLTLLLTTLIISNNTKAQGTRLLRQPDISASQITFIYGADLWISDLNGTMDNGLHLAVTEVELMQYM